MTVSRVMTIFVYKGLTRNPDIGNTKAWVLSNIWRLGWVRDIKYDTDVFNKWLLNTAKCQGYSFTFSELLRENQDGIKLASIPPFIPLMLRSKMMKNAFYFTLKALFALKIFKHLPWVFVQREKPLEEKDKVNSKIYDVSTCN